MRVFLILIDTWIREYVLHYECDLIVTRLDKMICYAYGLFIVSLRHTLNRSELT